MSSAGASLKPELLNHSSFHPDKMLVGESPRQFTDMRYSLNLLFTPVNITFTFAVCVFASVQAIPLWNALNAEGQSWSHIPHWH